MGSCKLQAGLHKKRGARSNRLRDPLSLPPPAQACVRHDDRSPQGSVPTEHRHFLWTNGGKEALLSGRPARVPDSLLRNRRHTETAMTLNFDQTLRREARQCFAYRRLTQRELFLQGRDIKSCARFKATTDQLRAQEEIGRAHV